MTNQDFLDAFDGKITVFGEKYERFGGGEFVRKTYEGELLPVLIEIAHKHSYSLGFGNTLEERVEDAKREFLEETGEVLTPLLVVEEIVGKNGDGCDYLLFMETGGVKLDLGWIEEDC